MSEAQKVSERLESFLQMVCPVNGLFMSRFDMQFSLQYTNAPNRQLLETIFLLGTEGDSVKLLRSIRISPAENYDRTICLFTNRWGLAWFSEVRVEGGEPQEVLVLGPVFLSRYSLQEIEDELYRLQITHLIRRMFMEEISKMPILSLNRFYEYGIMFHYCITGEQIQISDFRYQQGPDAQEDWISGQEERVNYQLEQQMVKLIEEGNTNFQKEFDMKKLSAAWSGDSGEDLIVQARNMVVMNATLASRAAIRGGMAPEASLALRREFIHEAGRAGALGALNEINTRMIRTYIRRVHGIQIQSGRSPQIQKCCDYIAANPDGQVSIHELAEMAGYTDYYFSKKFRKEVGVSVKEYIVQKKTEAAKELLRDTSLRVNEIAERLGYVNQGYFSDVFRQQTGMSPTEYRMSGGTSPGT